MPLRPRWFSFGGSVSHSLAGFGGNDGTPSPLAPTFWLRGGRGGYNSHTGSLLLHHLLLHLHHLLLIMGSSPQYTVFEVRPARHLCPRCRLPIAIRSSTGSRRKIGMARQAIDVGYHCNLVLYDAQLRQQHRLLYYYFSSWVHFFGESSQQPATWVHFFGESTSPQCFFILQ